MTKLAQNRYTNLPVMITRVKWRIYTKNLWLRIRLGIKIHFWNTQLLFAFYECCTLWQSQDDLSFENITNYKSRRKPGSVLQNFGNFCQAYNLAETFAWQQQAIRIELQNYLKNNKGLNLCKKTTKTNIEIKEITNHCWVNKQDFFRLYCKNRKRV